MPDVAELDIEVRSRGVKQSRADLDRLSSAGDRAERRITTATGRMRSGFDRLQRSVFSLKSAFAAIGVGLLVREIVQATTELQRIQNSLRVATGSAEGAAREFAFVSDEAERLGLNLRSAASEYAKLAAASRGTVLEGRQTREIFIAISEASTALGLSAEQTGGALNAIQQIISKGTVSAEELRGQLGERLPGAFQIAAKSIGVTTQELGKLLQQGALASEDLLPKFAAELRRTFSDEAVRASQNLQQQLNRLDTAIFKLTTSGNVDELAASIGGLADTLGDPEVRKGIQTLVQGVVDLTSISVRAVSDVGNFFTTLNQKLDKFMERNKEFQALVQGMKDFYGFVTFNPFTMASGPQDNVYTGTIQRNTSSDGDSPSNAIVASADEIEKARKQAEKYAIQQAKLTQQAIRDLETREEAVRRSYNERKILIENNISDEERRSALLVRNERKLQKDLNEIRQESYSEYQRLTDNAVENIQRSFSDSFTEIFRNGTNGFRGFADTIKDIFARLAGEIAAVMTVRGLGLEGLFSQLSGGGGSSFGMMGKMPGLFGGGGLQPIDTSSLPQRVTGNTLAGASTGAGGFGGMLGNLGFSGVLAYGANSFFKGLETLFSGGQRTGDKALAGLDVVFPGLGSVFDKVGDMFGVDLGGIFGGKDDPDFLFRSQTQGGNLLAQKQTPFGFIGLDPGGTENLSGETLNKFTDYVKRLDEQIAQGLTEAEIEAAKQAAANTPLPRVSVGGTLTPDELVFGIRNRYLAIMEALGVGRGGITSPDPGKFAQQIAGNFQSFIQPRVDLAEKIKTLKDSIMERIPALLNVQQLLGDAETRIGEFLLDLTSTTSSPLSPTNRLMNARQRFEDTLSLAKSGDQRALSSITGIAGNFLDVARQNFASSPEFFQRFEFVQNELQGLQGVLSQQQSSIDSTLNQLGISMETGNQERKQQLTTLIGTVQEMADRLDAQQDSLERLLAE